jgi:zeaxanthin glucosyltransferase
MKIAFLGVRVPGHLNPMTTLARKLKARGHDVVFLSSQILSALFVQQNFHLSPFAKMISQLDHWPNRCLL